MSPLLSLADEILIQIIRYVPKDSASTSATCPRLHSISEEILYASPQLGIPYAAPNFVATTSHRMCLLARTLILQPNLRRHVKCLSLGVINGGTLDKKELDEAIWKDAIRKAWEGVDPIGTSSPNVWARWSGKVLEHTSWAALLLYLVPNLKHLALEVLEGRYYHFTPHSVERYVEKPLELLFGWINSTSLVDPTLIPGLKNLTSLRLSSTGKLEIGWFKLQKLDYLHIGMVLSRAQIGPVSSRKQWDDDQERENLQLLYNSPISTLVLEGHVEEIPSLLRLLSYLEQLRDMRLFLTAIREAWAPAGRAIFETPRQQLLSGFDCSLQDFEDNDSLQSLTIQPLSDKHFKSKYAPPHTYDYPSFLSQICPFFNKPDLNRLKSLVVSQMNLLGIAGYRRNRDSDLPLDPWEWRLLPPSIQILSISEPTIEIQSWLGGVINDLGAIPNLRIIILFTRDQALLFLPSWMEEQCKKRTSRSVSLLLREPQLVRMSEGGAYRAPCPWN